MVEKRGLCEAPLVTLVTCHNHVVFVVEYPSWNIRSCEAHLHVVCELLIGKTGSSVTVRKLK